MGLYCDSCGDKVIYTLAPISCKCNTVREGYCLGCVNKLFEPSYKKIDEELYKKDARGHYVKFRKTAYISVESKPKCPQCKKPYDQEKFDDYGDAIRFYDESEDESEDDKSEDDNEESENEDKDKDDSDSDSEKESEMDDSNDMSDEKGKKNEDKIENQEAKTKISQDATTHTKRKFDEQNQDMDDDDEIPSQKK